jgi:hypothetical protein
MLRDAVPLRVGTDGAPGLVTALNEMLISEKPVKLSGRLHDVFVEDFKRVLAEIQSPDATHLYILAKATHLAHLRFTKYTMLIAAARCDGPLRRWCSLESVLANKVARERSRTLVRHSLRARLLND